MIKKSPLKNWFPALIMMGIIFFVSSQPSTDLPNFHWADKLFKKAGHMIGYALLAISYWHGLGKQKEKFWLAWLLAILYAATDEYHQSFTAGRHPSVWDVLIFDNFGSLIGLWVFSRFQKQNGQAETPDR